MNRLLLTLSLTVSLGASSAHAGPDDFHPGPLIRDHGAIAEVPGAAPIPPDSVFRIAYDVANAAEGDAVNRRFNTVARFLNMHVAAGVPAEQLQLAVVVHGGAHRDLLTDDARGATNPSADLIAQLVEHGVRFYLCGQTAAYYGVGSEGLLPGVELSLSAMTVHAQLQQQGYTLNPF